MRTGVTSTMMGAIVSILLTVASTDPVFPARSEKRKVNVPFDENVFVDAPLLFVIVMTSLAPVRVTMTDPLVEVFGVYCRVAVGTVVSIVNPDMVREEEVLPAGSFTLRVHPV